MWYVDNCSLLFDLKILLFTIVKVIKRKGININSGNTTKPFDIYLKNKYNRQISKDNICLLDLK